MKQHSFYSILLFGIIVAACAAIPAQYTQLEMRSVEADRNQSVLIQIDYGEVTILESPDSLVHVEGQVLFSDRLEYQVDSSEEQIRIKIFVNRDSSVKAPLQVIIRVPQQMQVKVETKNASVAVRSYQGDLDVASIAGDITLEQVSGKASLRSDRGNISAMESSGRLGIVGNYGKLATRDVRGEISLSTIMGDVSFEGVIGEEDIVRFETDHGPVSVRLSGDSSLVLKAGSASGDVTCMLPEITSTARTCTGELGSGAGSLWIRTVSGAITIQAMP